MASPRDSTTASNGSLDARRWRTPAAERDDLVTDSTMDLFERLDRDAADEQHADTLTDAEDREGPRS